MREKGVSLLQHFERRMALKERGEGKKERN